MQTVQREKVQTGGREHAYFANAVAFLTLTQQQILQVGRWKLWESVTKSKTDLRKSADSATKVQREKVQAGGREHAYVCQCSSVSYLERNSKDCKLAVDNSWQLASVTTKRICEKVQARASQLCEKVQARASSFKKSVDKS